MGVSRVAVSRVRVPDEQRAYRKAILLLGFGYLMISGLSLGFFALWFTLCYLLYRILETRITGDCARIGPRQLPEVYHLLVGVSADMGVPVPDLYVSDEADPLPIYTLDLKRPTIVLATDYARKLKEPELRFLLAHEIGHMQAGHLRLLSILNVLEAHPPVSRWLTTPLEMARWVLRPWSLRADETADRLALLAVDEDVEAAAGALAKVAAGVELGDRVNPEAFREQARELRTGRMTWINELLFNRVLLVRRLKLIEDYAVELESRRELEESRLHRPGRLERLRRFLLPPARTGGASA